MGAIFVTATGTGIGKTFVTAALARHFRDTGQPVRVLKPVLTGFDPGDFSAADPAILLEAAGKNPTLAEIERISPFRFAAPLAPNLAAAREGRTLDFEAVVEFCRNAAKEKGPLLVEGIGGLMVPLDGKRTVLDWIKALGWPSLLVTGSYLGAISHTLTALEVMKYKKLGLKGIVVSETETSSVDLADTATTLRLFSPGEVIALPRGGDPRAIERIAGLL